MEQDRSYGRQVPYFLISEDGMGFSGTMGCNRITGPLNIEGESVEFGLPASTMMACPPQMAEREAAFAETLEVARRVDLMDQGLQLLEGAGIELARFQSMYTRY